MADLQEVRIPQCVTPELRQTLQQLADNNQTLAPLAQLINPQNPTQPAIPLTYIYILPADVDAPPAIFVDSTGRVGELQEDLHRDSEATIELTNGKEMKAYGYFVKSGFHVPSGKRVDIQPRTINGVLRWCAIVTDDCLVENTP